MQSAMNLTPTRRTVLLAGAGGTSALVLAACSSSSGDGSRQPAGRSAAGGSRDGGGGGGDATLATLADIPVGQAVVVKLPDGSPAVVARPASNKALAFSATCTHLGCTVQAKGAKLVCPCHGSQYNALTGQVLHGPAPRALPKIAVQVTDGKVVAGQA